jgi:hypothetical protein
MCTIIETGRLAGRLALAFVFDLDLHRTSGAQAFGYFALFKVTRRKGGTHSGRYRSNGCVHPQKTSGLMLSHR